MSICSECADAGDSNRRYHDRNDPELKAHPDSCGCPCRHEEPQQWEKMFSSGRPIR